MLTKSSLFCTFTAYFYFAVQSSFMTMPLNPGDELTHIRSMMERSSRFISLSGISGIIAGTAALVGVIAAAQYFGALKNFYLHADKIYDHSGSLAAKFLTFLFVDALLVSTIAIGAGIFFTSRRARLNGQQIWGPLTKRMTGKYACCAFTAT